MKDDSLKEKTLLVVDDEADLREIISMELEYFGAKVFQAESVAKALEVLANHSIDLIISDIRMPGSTGIDLLKKVRTQHASTPSIILITGFADLDTAQAMSLGAEALVHKPFDMDELLNMVQNHLMAFPDRFKNVSTAEGNLHFYFEQNFATELNQSLYFGRGGVKIIHKDQPIPIGHPRKIELHFKDQTFEFDGIVRWKKITDSEVSMGIEYTHLSNEMIPIAQNFQNETSYIP